MLDTKNWSKEASCCGVASAVALCTCSTGEPEACCWVGGGGEVLCSCYNRSQLALISVHERCVHEHGHTNIKKGVIQAVRDEALHLIQLPLMLLAGDLLLGQLGESPLSSAELRRKLQNQTEGANKNQSCKYS